MVTVDAGTQPHASRRECGHLAGQHTDDEHERCTVAGCGCKFFVHDEASWRVLAFWMSGRSDEVLAAVKRSLSG